MILSKLKEAIICWRAGRVTRNYPFAPSPPAEGFRGQPELDIDKCTGCGSCAMACPTRCIEIHDEGDERRTVYCLDRCSYCGRCEEVCPEDAIELSEQFELATDDIDDIRITTHHELVRCAECDRVVGTRREIENLASDLAEETQLRPEQLTWLTLCIECKRRHSLETAQALQGEDDEPSSSGSSIGRGSPSSAGS